MARNMKPIEVSTFAEDIFSFNLTRVQVRTDHLFALIFLVQWVFAIVCAVWISPYTWVGNRSTIHLHIWCALVLGGALSVYPIYLAWARPGQLSTRMTIAVSQMLYSGLLIHLTGGRIETHFHIFGSLALLAFYRDWRVFVPATLVVAGDHLVRGIFWPESIFGVLQASPWRALEHSGWVLFEDMFLIWGCVIAVREMRETAIAMATLEDAKLEIEDKVVERTNELQQRTHELEAEMTRSQALEQQVIQSQKLESIGQLAAGVAHEINTPMQFINDNNEFMDESCRKLFEALRIYQDNLDATGSQRPWKERAAAVKELVDDACFDRFRQEIPRAIEESREGIRRVIGIIQAMKEFSHPGEAEKVEMDLNHAISSTATITRNRWKYVAELELDLDPNLPTLSCVPHEINQVMLNLIVNAADAITERFGESGDERGVITIRTRQHPTGVEVEVEDTGCGMPEEVRTRIFDPFFTTKDVGKGTGQGLSICYNIVVNNHGGLIDVESWPGKGTMFRISLPLVAAAEEIETPELDEIAVESDGIAW